MSKPRAWNSTLPMGEPIKRNKYMARPKWTPRATAAITEIGPDNPNRDRSDRSRVTSRGTTSVLGLDALMDKVDALARKECHLRNRCEFAGLDGLTCGPVADRRNLEWAHIKGRGDKSVRHFPLDSLCSCPVHHDYYDLHPAEAEDLIEEAWPGRLARLAYLSRTLQGSALATVARLEEWIAFFKTGVLPSFATPYDVLSAHTLSEGGADANA